MTRRHALIAALALAATVGAGCAPGAGPVACSTYPNQAAAQTAGAARDGDGDGVLCETLPCPCSGDRGDAPKRAQSGRPAVLTGRAVRAADGDTVTVELDDGSRETVRLIGVDAPEKSALRFGHAQCGGTEAAEAARALTERFPRVRLTLDPSQDTRDRYGRLLAYVDVPSARTSYQRELLANGWGAVYVFDRPFARLREFRAGEADAKRARLGIWQLCDAAG